MCYYFIFTDVCRKTLYIDERSIGNLEAPINDEETERISAGASEMFKMFFRPKRTNGKLTVFT